MIITRAAASLYIATIVLSRGKVSSAHDGSVRKLSDSPWSANKPKYEVWGSDQSNSVSTQTSRGKEGSFLWIWDSDSIQTQVEGGDDAVPLTCTPDKYEGPCDLFDIFPKTLVDETGSSIEELGDFGRLHGVIKDPSNRYVNANIFAPSGGYIGVIDTLTKEAIGLFRVTKTEGTGTARSVHMSFWTTDGKYIIIANLHGKMVERINVKRDKKGIIIGLEFDKSAGIYLGMSFVAEESATVFTGTNAFGNNLMGKVIGSYADADTGPKTPAGEDKESDERPNNVPICPVPSSKDNIYVTLGGGGIFVVKANNDENKMQIVGEYTNRIVNGAGCAGVETREKVFITGGVSASGAGFDQSTFTVYAFDDTKFSVDAVPQQNFPFPDQVFKDPSNTNSIGNIDQENGDGAFVSNASGQLPSKTTRRDSHGAALSRDGKYVHVVDRIQNVIEVFDADTLNRVNTYDLVSKDGKSGRAGPAGPCLSRGVLDDRDLQLNDPAPDLLETTPDGRYLVVAFRGPAPVTVAHGAQGSCPGVGLVELSSDGMSGKLVDVLRSTNTIDTSDSAGTTGGHDYTGAERSDVHGAIVVQRA